MSLLFIELMRSRQEVTQVGPAFSRSYIFCPVSSRGKKLKQYLQRNCLSTYRPRIAVH